MLKKFLVLLCLGSFLVQGCGRRVEPVLDERQPTRVMSRAFLPVASAGTPGSVAPYPLQGEEQAPGNGQEAEPGQALSWVEAHLQAMSLSQKIGQMLVTGLEEDATQFDACPLIQQLTPGGVFYHPGNVDDPEQLRLFSAAVQACAQSAHNLPVFIALDHEGQYVNRFDRGVTVFPAALAQGASGDPELAYRIALAAGQELAFSGVNLVLGPVADVLSNPDNEVISQRTFGSDPQRVAEFVKRAVEGYRQAGLIPALKHFPGHGGVAGDTHRVLPVDESDRAQLESLYLPPFASGLSAGAPMVMLSHVAFPNVAGTVQPASLSPAMVRLLREDLGFQGVILTDAMDMRAVSGARLNVAEAALEAVRVGVDLLLVTDPGQALATHARLLLAVEQGELPLEHIDRAVAHILSLKQAQGLHSFPLPQPPEPEWQSHASLAAEAGQRAVTRFKDEGELLPLPAGVRRVLVVGPNSEWEFYPVLEAALRERGIETEFWYYSLADHGPVPERELLESLPERAALADLTLLFTWQAYLNTLLFEDDWPEMLVENFLQVNPAMVVVALKSPTDIRAFPGVPAYLALYGTTPGALQGLLEVLLSGWEPPGKNPLPGL